MFHTEDRLCIWTRGKKKTESHSCWISWEKKHDSVSFSTINTIRFKFIGNPLCVFCFFFSIPGSCVRSPWPTLRALPPAWTATPLPRAAASHMACGGRSSRRCWLWSSCAASSGWTWVTWGRWGSSSGQLGVVRGSRCRVTKQCLVLRARFQNMFPFVLW